MMLHVRELTNMLACPRLAWLHRQFPVIPEAFYRFDESFSQMWARFLDVEDAPEGVRNDKLERTLALMQDHDAIRHARLEYRGLRCTIPLMLREGDGWTFLFAYRNGMPRQTEAPYLKLCLEVAKKCGIQVTGVEVLFLNKDYERQGDLDPNALFVLSDRLFHRKGGGSAAITDALAQEDLDVDALIDQARALFSGPEPEAVLVPACSKGRRCMHYDACHQVAARPDSDVLFLKGIPRTLGMPVSGDMKDMEVPLSHGTARSQVLAAKEGGVHIEQEKLQAWLDQVQYPVSYLDFEWDSFGFPPYDGMHPLDVLCFQYSLHVEDEAGNLTHTGFFQAGDCRKAFVESLLASVPESGSVLVYNLKGAEALRVRQLAAQFPEYEDELLALVDRMLDLSMPFEKGWYYDLAMKGRFSLKNVLPVFDSGPGYESLSIQNGLEAVHAYRSACRQDAAGQEEIGRRISSYCAMDTYAEYVVFHGLLEGVKNDAEHHHPHDLLG